MWFTLMLWSSTSAVRAVQRDLDQVSATYECDEGHHFVGLLDTKSAPCTEKDCQRRAWPIWSYQCTKHGAFVYQLRYYRDPQQRSKIKDARPAGGTWDEVQEALICAHCERTLLPDITLRLPQHSAESEAPSAPADPPAEGLTDPRSPQD